MCSLQIVCENMKDILICKSSKFEYKAFENVLPKADDVPVQVGIKFKKTFIL